MRLHFIVHEDFEAPGAYEIWAQNNDFKITYSRVYLNEALPSSAEDIDFLIVMGGPQDPDTSPEMCPHFNSLAEQSIIKKAIEANKVVIGVCLGSQLIGQALGAKFEHSPEREIGKFPIMLTEYGITNSKFSHLGKMTEVGHWHNDMPGLTPNAKIIAFSAGCPRQIIEYSKLVYGLQCHMELTSEVVELLIQHSEAELNQAHHYKFVNSREELQNHDYKEMNQNLFIFLDKLKDEYSKQH
ncbi:type 1 glutamine amidotransferase [Acinetobacter oleivorans]|uniref:type 1 glutamine amidotransferase n=1 Tax=Acinetobacter oleivorans TaxID=1148157 RepID=UPI0015803634|nr:type 1 glutamine amidotransferase [Acinetobacter oleivorans]NUF13682.1 type 1 glutamine amidotransferase [Acinetobacter oleivorans]NUF35817.1 type 1 glutamine amidotransferase [Acinetobacter oleivorans]